MVSCYQINTCYNYESVILGRNFYTRSITDAKNGTGRFVVGLQQVAHDSSV